MAKPMPLLEIQYELGRVGSRALSLSTARKMGDERDMGLQIGDAVIVSCEPASARVVEVDSRQVTLEWPWGAIDNSSNFRWDGRFSLPYGDSNPEWVPYRLESTCS